MKQKYYNNKQKRKEVKRNEIEKEIIVKKGRKEGRRSQAIQEECKYSCQKKEDENNNEA